MRLIRLFFITAACGPLALLSCAKPTGPAWGGANELATGAIQQTAVAGLPRSSAVALWSQALTAEALDTDQSGLNVSQETRYRISSRLAMYASYYGLLPSGDSAWSTPALLNTGAPAWTRREDRNNSTGAVTRIYSANDQVFSAQPRIAADSNGHALAVWQQQDSYTNAQGVERTVRHVYHALFDANTHSWTTPAPLDQGVATTSVGSLRAGEPLDAFNPDISVSSSGDALAVWQQMSDAGGVSQIMARRYRPDLGWPVVAQKISTAAVGRAADMPRVQMQNDNSGVAFAVWRQHETSVQNSANIDRHGVYAAKYASAAWASAVKISDGLTEAVAPTISVNTNGKAVAAWAQVDYIIDGSGNVADPYIPPRYAYSIYANRFVSTTWLSAAEAVDTDTATAHAVDVTIDDNDGIHAVWLQSSTPPGDIWNNDSVMHIYRRDFVNNAWGATLMLDDQTRFDADTPHIIGRGSALLTYWKRWRDPRGGGGYDIMTQLYRNGAWGDSTRLSANDDAYATSASFDQLGTAYVAWSAFDKAGAGQLWVNSAAP
ncbi:MAG: hypothetical protein AABY83_01480 [Pseudomonadota bacterium]